MPSKIFGASLGEILRHGSQFGLGVREAGRQNQADQRQADTERQRAEEQALLAQALLDQRHAQIRESDANAKRLAIPKGPSWQIRESEDGMVRIDPDTGNVEPIMSGLDRLKPPKSRVQGPDMDYNRRVKALEARGIVGPEAEAIASDAVLFRAQFGGGGKDSTAMRQRALAAARAVAAIQSQFTNMDPAERKALLESGSTMQKRIEATLLPFGFSSIEELNRAQIGGDTPGDSGASSQQQRDWDEAAAALEARGGDVSIIGPRPNG